MQEGHNPYFFQYGIIEFVLPMETEIAIWNGPTREVVDFFLCENLSLFDTIICVLEIQFIDVIDMPFSHISEDLEKTSFKSMSKQLRIILKRIIIDYNTRKDPIKKYIYIPRKKSTDFSP